MSAKLMFMFSGQGSQYYQMGRALYDHDKVFRASMRDMDNLVRGLCGASVTEQLYDAGRAASTVFDDIRLTHPAIVMLELALGDTLLARGIKPSACLGASLGMLAAGVFADALQREEALAHAVECARLMNASAPAGGMVAVLADRDVHTRLGIRESFDVAGENFPGHHVIAGLDASLAACERQLANGGVTFQRLPVRYAFHSRWMAAVEAPLRLLSARLRTTVPQLPLYCCAAGGALSSLPEHHFWEIAREPVRFSQTIAAAERACRWHYVDVGPAGTLATFVKYLQPNETPARVSVTLTPFRSDLASVERALSSIGSHA